MIDHLSDVIYTYFDEYKEQGVREGLNPRNIVVIQNLIVDVLQHYYFDRQDEYDALATPTSSSPSAASSADEYYLMTCHRRENVEDTRRRCTAILELIAASPAARSTSRPATAPRSGSRVRLDAARQRDHGRPDRLPGDARAAGQLTRRAHRLRHRRRGDCVLGVPSLQIRKATERPQVYDCGSSVKFDPGRPDGLSGRRGVREARSALRPELSGPRAGRRPGVGAAGRRPGRRLRQRHDPRPPSRGLATSTFRARTARTACPPSTASLAGLGSISLPGRRRARLQRGSPKSRPPSGQYSPSPRATRGGWSRGGG